MAQLTFPFSLPETFSHCDSTLLSLLNQQTFWKNCRKLFIPINLVCVSIEEIRGSIVDRSVRREMELDARNGKRLRFSHAFAAGRESSSRLQLIPARLPPPPSSSSSSFPFTGICHARAARFPLESCLVP